MADKDGDCDEITDREVCNKDFNDDNDDMFTIIFAMGIVMMVMMMMMKYFASSDANLHPLLDLRLLPLSSAASIPTTNTIRIIIIDNNEVIIWTICQC